MKLDTIHCGDTLDIMRTWPDACVHCIVTSPPYWGLRDYGVEGQLGLEKTPGEYVAKMVEIFAEVKRVLRDDGTLWLNLGDSYAAHNSGNNGYTDNRTNRKERYAAGIPAGLKPKDLVGIPWRVAFALQSDGWYLRSDIIWHKPNPMPESVRDRCTKAHEYIFLLSKSARYFYDHEASKEPRQDWGTRDRKPGSAFVDGTPGRSKQGGGQNCNFADAGRNKRSVWTVATRPLKDAHFATFPPKLIEPCILAGCPEGGVVFDPFMGAGTTGLVARKHNRHYLGCELNPEYVAMAERRIRKATELPLFDRERA